MVTMTGLVRISGPMPTAGCSTCAARDEDAVDASLGVRAPTEVSAVATAGLANQWLPSPDVEPDAAEAPGRA